MNTQPALARLLTADNPADTYQQVQDTLTDAQLRLVQSNAPIDPALPDASQLHKARNAWLALQEDLAGSETETPTAATVDPGFYRRGFSPSAG